MQISDTKRQMGDTQLCSLLLLRSLIDTLLGTGDKKADLEAGWDGYTVRISYNKYNTLPGVLLDLLSTG